MIFWYFFDALKSDFYTRFGNETKCKCLIISTFSFPTTLSTCIKHYRNYSTHSNTLSTFRFFLKKWVFFWKGAIMPSSDFFPIVKLIGSSFFQAIILCFLSCMADLNNLEFAVWRLKVWISEGVRFISVPVTEIVRKILERKHGIEQWI